MNIVEPIRDLEQIEAMKQALQKSKRNTLLFVMGINSALRITDLLSLTIGDVVDRHGEPRKEIKLKTGKGGRMRTFPIGESVSKALVAYLGERRDLDPEAPLFISQKGKGSKALGRHRAWYILREAGESIGLERLGTHTLRKTFGYHAYIKSGGNLSLVRKLLHHAPGLDTLGYIGVKHDPMDEVYLNLNL
jgi:integrase